MDQQGLKQPLLGILGLIVVLFISFGIMVWFKTETFLTWAGTLAMCMIPFSVVAGLVWQGNYPPPAAKLEQPLKGLYLLLITMIVGALVGAWSLKTVGGFAVPPTPFLIIFIIKMLACDCSQGESPRLRRFVHGYYCLRTGLGSIQDILQLRLCKGSAVVFSCP
jgi:hypothetical protein